MKKLMMIAFVFGMFGSAYLSAAETPRATVLIYIAHLKAGNFKAAFRQRVDGGSGISEKYKEMASVLFDDVRIVDTEQIGFSSAYVYVSVKNPISGERITLPVKLVKINGNWKIANQKE